MGVFFSGSSCQVTNATEELYFLWVSGMPEYIAAPIPDVIPVINSNGILFYFKNSGSSPPIPKINGSHTYSLYTFSVFSGNKSMISFPINLSYKIISDSFIRSSALIVSNFGSPGPAPQINIFPTSL
jgi:hypothetical protein